MKIQNPAMPTIPEVPTSYSPSSQNAQIGVGFHNSDIAMNYLASQRLQAQMRAAEVPSVTVATKARTACYKLALCCGVLTFPAIACAFFIKKGWIIPVGFATSCLLLFLLSGKRTAEIENLSRELEQNNQEGVV